MKNVEIIASNFNAKSEDIKLFAIYNPLAIAVQSLINALYAAVRKHCDELEKLIIMGDFNLDIMKSSGECDVWQAFMSDMDLKQLIDKPTTDMRTAIDPVYSNIANVACVSES